MNLIEHEIRNNLKSTVFDLVYTAHSDVHFKDRRFQCYSIYSIEIRNIRWLVRSTLAQFINTIDIL
jgi:hypothetical protein